MKKIIAASLMLFTFSFGFANDNQFNTFEFSDDNQSNGFGLVDDNQSSINQSLITEKKEAAKIGGKTRYTFVTSCGETFSVVMSSGFPEESLFNIMNSINLEFCNEEIDDMDIFY